MTAAATPPTIRSLALTVYLPTFLFGAGQGAVIPIVPLLAKDLGASVAVAGMIVAARGVGTLVFDLPAGSLVSRVGERRAMVVATGFLLVSLLGCLAADSVLVFALSMLLMGCGWSVWLLARLAYVTDAMPDHLRGRALSTLGGTMRVGNFVGPFLSAGAISVLGLAGPYWVHLVLAVAGLGVLFLVPDVDDQTDVRHGPVKFRTLGREHASVWTTVGLGVLCIGVLRSCRQMVLPLWAAQIGVDPAGVAVIFGISSGMDMLLFYPAGSASDRWGRKVVAGPCMSLLSLGFLVMPMASTFGHLVLVGLLLGFGNGLGAGIVMTLGSDFAPVIGRAEFLGLWRLVGDIGTSGGPLVASAAAAAFGLAASPLVVASVGAAGVMVMLFRVPEPLQRQRPELPPSELDPMVVAPAPPA